MVDRVEAELKIAVAKYHIYVRQTILSSARASGTLYMTGWCITLFKNEAIVVFVNLFPLVHSPAERTSLITIISQKSNVTFQSIDALYCTVCAKNPTLARTKLPEQESWNSQLCAIK